MIALLLLVVIAVAYANGANDVSKGVGTLVGSGVTTYARALRWGTIWTVAGAGAAMFVSAGLVRTFSTGLLHSEPAETDRFLLSVSAGVFLWVIVASRAGLPVSTTHALTGAIVGTALVMGGTGAVQWPLLAATVLAPLALSPFLSGIIAYALHAASASRLSAASQYCVCLEQQSIRIASMSKTGAAAAAAAPAARVLVGDAVECGGSGVVSRLRLTDAMHWGSSAVLSFARGLNDNPKIVALGIAAAGSGIFIAGAAAMGLGSYLYGRRVTKTLAEKVAKIDRTEGLSASIVASVLVLLASFFALPVSTTHVATGAIVGGGLRSGSRSIHWNMVGAVGFAWLITLPAAALAAAAAWSILGISF